MAAARTREPADHLPVARVSVDMPLAHLDRPFDYLVPARDAEAAQPGVRVRVRFGGQLVDGYLLERVDSSTHDGKLALLERVVSPEPVLGPELRTLARAVADRYAGTLADVLRLAIPPRHARVEGEAAADPAGADPTGPPDTGWPDYPAGSRYLDLLAAGESPRAVWSALPGADWPNRVAAAVRACLASGRGAVVVVPDARDLDEADAALTAALGKGRHVALSAGLGPAERYRRWLAARRGTVTAVVGTRAAAFAPVTDPGLLVLWDDGDDLHAEPRAPYPHAREVLLLRAELSRAALLLGGYARTAEAQLLLDTGWAKPLEARRETVRVRTPRVVPTDDQQLANDPAARSARLPAVAFRAARTALAVDMPVLVQVPRRGYVPGLACQRCRTPARCPHCAGPLGAGPHGPPACRWCGRPVADWACAACGDRRLRATVVGARRTAEELGRAFPGVPVRTSGRDAVLARIPAGAALVVATPGAEPLPERGYGAALLLDSWALLGRPDLRAGEETLRRWCAAAALVRPEGTVVVTADAGLRPVQALVRWDGGWHAGRELAERRELGFPPAVRMASLTGTPAGIADFLAVLAAPDSTDVLGPVPAPGAADDDTERVLLRVPRRDGPALAGALAAAQSVRTARKTGDPVRVQVDPLELL
ncbi:MAG: primosomal protein N' [Mycobacteriales bacterium]